AVAILTRDIELAPSNTEQLALEQRRRQRRAFHVFERAPRAGARIVNEPRNGPLAGSGLSREEHAQVEVGHATCRLDDGTHPRTLGHELPGVGRRQPGAQADDLAAHLPVVERAMERATQRLRLATLRDV